ncbi:MAG: hypothetical protein WBD40_08090 [Tepidisphaeraceae bacterium]
MSSKGNPNEAEASKRSDYPYATFLKALEIAEAVRGLGGNNGNVRKSLIAHKLKVSESAPSLNQNIGSAKCFSMIDGRGSYRLTDTAKRYFFPTKTSEKRAAMLAMIKSPTIFESLIERFDGEKIPPTDVLVNVLHREHDVSESWRPRVATLFLSTMREAEVIDSSGILRYRASLHAADDGTMSVMNSAAQPIVSTPPPVQRERESVVAAESGSADIWQFRGIRLQTPEHMSIDLWKKLSDYVNVLKPMEDSKQE